jgi:hypothetical protein
LKGITKPIFKIELEQFLKWKRPVNRNSQKIIPDILRTKINSWIRKKQTFNPMDEPTERRSKNSNRYDIFLAKKLEAIHFTIIPKKAIKIYCINIAVVYILQ